jgi:hypothetical protein
MQTLERINTERKEEYPVRRAKKTINRITASTKSTASQARKTIAKGKTKAQ